MKHYYITDHALWQSFPKEHFAQSHWIETDTPGKILVVAEFRHDPGHDLWESMLAVESLPHLLFGKGPVKAEHIAHLKKSIGATDGDDVLTVAQKAGKIHPMFRPERL